MVTLSVMMMFSLVCLSSCKSSVNSDQTKTITITYGCSDNNGTIEARVISSKEGKIEGNKIINLVSGDKIQFTAKPNNGYKFKEWIPKQLGNKETFELTVDKNLTVSAEFGPIEKEPLTVDALRKELKVEDDSPIVTSPYGLGLIKKDGQFKYQMLENGNTVAKTGEELIQMMKDVDDTDYLKQSGGPNLGDKFDTLPGILEAKWNFAKNSDKIVPKERKMLIFNKGGKDPIVGLYELIGSDYYISYRNGEMYVEVANTGTHYFADWTFAFVKKSNPSEVYVFSVGEIGKDSEGEIKPYLLRDGGKYPDVLKVNRCKYLPALVELPDQVPKPTSEPGPESDPDRYTGMKLCRTYRFSLSSLLEGYLRYSLLDPNNGKYVLENDKKEDKEVPRLSEKFIKDMANCDVYILTGVPTYQSGKMFSTRTNFRECWRNVLKLTEHEFWNKCFKE